MLSNNKISSITYQENSHNFPALKSLFISYNLIQDWSSIDCFNKFPKIEELRINNNPLFNSLSSSTARIFTIARIQNLTILNGSIVCSSYALVLLLLLIIIEINIDSIS